MTKQSLQSFIEEVSGDSHLRVQDDLGDGFVRLRAAEAQRRQAKQDIRSFEDVVIEMLRNSRDAHANIIFVATWKEGSTRHLTMIDNGQGIPESMHETVFEPFVTSKLDTFHSDRWGVHGRGMALYSIRENTDSAYVVQSAPHKGSVLFVSAYSAKLPEKKDQSTLPRITKTEEGMVLRGPHNILRTVMEFAIDERNTTTVYLGSPTEIAATLYNVSLNAMSRVSSIFEESLESLPYMHHLSFADDTTYFTELAETLALPLSERSARRIMDGEIRPLNPYLEMLISSSEPTESKTPASKARTSKQVSKAHSIKLSPEDKLAFASSVKQAYETLAEAYYLDSNVDADIRIDKDSLRISIPLIERGE